MTDPTPVGLIGGFIFGSSNVLVRKRGSADRMSYNKRRDISQLLIVCLGV